jgi:BASS family bile acid:Na+ symporter
MQTSILTEVLLPLALAFIMFGMGLTLTRQDFLQLFKTPKAIFVGLLGQILLLPLLTLSICLIFELSAPLTIGLMVLAACPGGTMSNLISHLARANLALSVSLTAISTLICVFSTPFIIQYSINQFAGENPPDFSIIGTVFGLVFVTLLPVAIGITIRHFYKNWSLKVEVFFRRFSLTFMVLMIFAILIKERATLMTSLEQAFLACLALNICSILLGLILAKVFSLSFTNAITLGIEVGIQNAALAMLICISFLDAPDFAVTPGIYGLAMYIGPGLLAIWAKAMRAKHPTNKLAGSA